ncbi:hypothetical protein MMC14_005574 [Varicellaria rhodocarpa]|nr:hypothetical protein [Varicellaria rhodocarpa]
MDIVLQPLPSVINPFRAVVMMEDGKKHPADTSQAQISEENPKEPPFEDRFDRARTQWLSRQTYHGTLLFNLLAFFLPALYSTLSKLWVADIDSSQVVTTDMYTYIGVIAQVLNDSLPRSAWLVVGDKSTRTTSSRLSISYTMILVQTVLGAIMTVIFVAASEKLAGAFVPKEVREVSLTYVRISSVSALSSAMETVVSSCTRALDHPDVPLAISSTKFVVNIILDLLIISKFHVGSFTPTVNTQALIRLACDMTSALPGLVYFVYIAMKVQRRCPSSKSPPILRIRALKVLLRPSTYTFIESAIRNSLYLWLVRRIVLMGEDYATAWGVFNTIRWGLIVVPVQALEASTLTFVGHNWGRFRASVGVEIRRPKASKHDILAITRPALLSTAIAFVFELVICISLSTRGIQAFAYYLSQSHAVAAITQTMWKTIDWCYIFYGLNYQLAAILLATSPRWYLYQALLSNFLWILPWAIVVTTIDVPQTTAWTYYAVIFGRALVFDVFAVLGTVSVWAWRLARGKVKVGRVGRNVKIDGFLGNENAKERRD